jgi:hypothetical protein
MIDLVAQTVNVDINDVRCWIDAHLPNVVEDHTSRHDAPGIATQIFQEHEFLRGEAQGLTIARRLPAHKIELQVGHANTQCFALWSTRAPEEVAEAGKQFRQGERFGKVIIPALFQSQDAFIDRTSRRQNQNRSVTALRAASPDEIQAVTVGQAEVDDECVMNALKGERFGGRSVRSRVNLVSGFRERSLEKIANCLIVLYKK